MDVYHRLTALPIRISPLRERHEDIAILAHHFVKKYAAAAGKSIHTISTDALQVLIQHDFPGNVRELENIIESAVLFETTDQLQPQSLPLYLTQEDSQAATGGTRDVTVILPLDEVEQNAIIHALKVTSSNMSDAARGLGIGRNTLYRKLEKYNLLP